MYHLIVAAMQVGGDVGIFDLYGDENFWKGYIASALITFPIVLVICSIYKAAAINKMKDQLAQVDKRVKRLGDRLDEIKPAAVKTQKRPTAGGHESDDAENPSQSKMRQAEEQYAQGMRYSEGDGVEKDLEQAVRYFRKAADAGHAPAQFVMAACFHTGYGVEADPALAVEWYRKAAEQGHAEAQFNLGACYASGYGVKKDPDRAIDWYRNAAAQDNEDAKAALREIAPPIFRVNA